MSRVLTWDVIERVAETIDTSLENTDAVLSTLAEPGSDCQTGGTGSDNDVVVALRGKSLGVIGGASSDQIHVLLPASSYPELPCSIAAERGGRKSKEGIEDGQEGGGGEERS